MDPNERLHYPEEELLDEIRVLRSRQADEYRSLEEDYRQRHQRLHEAHEQEIQNCIRRYFAKNNQEQPEDLSLHRGVPTLTPLPSAPDSAQSSQFGSPPLLGGHLGGQHTPSSSQQLPIVTLDLLMPPPASLGGLSSHSSNEDCSGCSYAVKHKLQEHLMQKHRRECTTCALKMGNITGECNCDMNNPGVGAGVKLRPVIRTYSAPLPLTNPQLLQPPPFHPHGNISGGGGGMANMQISSDPYPTPPSDQEMYNIKQHIRNNVLQKSKFKRKSSAQK